MMTGVAGCSGVRKKIGHLSYKAKRWTGETFICVSNFFPMISNNSLFQIRVRKGTVSGRLSQFNPSGS